MLTILSRGTLTFLFATVLGLSLLIGTERGTLAAVDPCEDPARPPTITGAGNITGTSGDDVIYGSDGPDTIDGGSGNDLICAFGGDDDLSGGSGNDELFGGLGADVGSGGSGNDVVAGNGTVIVDESSSDAVDGGSGDDFLSAFGGVPLLNGGSGNDSLTSGSPDAVSNGGSGTDSCHVDEGLDPSTGIPPSGSGSVTSCEEIESGGLG